MIGLGFDENFNNDVIRGLLRRRPQLDLARVQDAGQRGRDDPAVLAWAAAEGRVLVSHDVTTLTAFAYARVKGSQPMPGLIEAGPDVPPEVLEVRLNQREAAGELQEKDLVGAGRRRCVLNDREVVVQALCQFVAQVTVLSPLRTSA